MATKHGVNAVLYMGATTAIPITETHGITIGAETDFAEDSSQGDTWKTYLPGLSDITTEFEKWFDSAAGGGTLLAAAIARTLQKVYFYPDRADDTVYLYGTGYVGGGGFDAPIGDIVNQTYSFRFTSQPTYIHP
jgi:hypothetical protein